jgi:hypothetical protein
MTSEGAHPIGISSDAQYTDAEVCVSTASPAAGRQWVLVTWSDGIFRCQVQLQLFLEERRVEATVESEGDCYPQPPPAWWDVDGMVAISSWDWRQSKPIVIEYDLYGGRGGELKRTSSKVILAPSHLVTDTPK